MSPNIEPPKYQPIGFIGVGAIAEAVIVGLLEHGNFDGSIFVSKRSTVRSTALAERYTSVSVASDNQKILDQCDLVFLSVLPIQAREVLTGLKFRNEQTLASLVAGINLNELGEMCSPIPKLARMIPLPPIEHGLGPLPICPPNPELKQLFRECAQVIETDDEDQFSTFSAVSGLMSTHHAIVATTAAWMQNQGIEPHIAAEYSSNMFRALTEVESNSNLQELAALADESTTAGGLNEQVLHELRHADWFGVLVSRLEGLKYRLAQS